MTYEDYFEPQLLERAWEVNARDNSYPVLCSMTPSLFLQLAMRGLDPHALQELPKPDKGGAKWNTLPALAIGCVYDEAKVVDHDGRHRAIYLITQGIEEMMVLLYLNVSPIDMPSQVVDEDGNMVYPLPSNVVQTRNFIYHDWFEPKEWSDPFLHKTKTLYRSYFDGGGEFIL